MPRPRGRSAEIRCWITHESRDKFVHHYPTKHAFSWVLQTAIDAINDLTDNTPTTVEVIQSSIREAVLAQRAARRTQPKPSSPDDNAESINTATPNFVVEQL